MGPYLSIVYALEQDTLSLYLEDPKSLVNRYEDLRQTGSAEHGITLVFDKEQNKLVACFIHDFTKVINEASDGGLFGYTMRKDKVVPPIQEEPVDYDALYTDLINFIEKGTDGSA